MYHSRSDPLNIVGKVQHIRPSKVPYNNIWIWKSTIYSNRLVLLSKASNDERRKLVGIGSSYMSLVNADRPKVGLVDPSSLDYLNSRRISFKR